MAVNVVYENNFPEFRAASERFAKKSLEMCGLTAESYAKPECPVDTGALRNSITHEIEDETVYIGTNMEYAPYVELGTGVYATMGGGRSTPWVYQDGKGNWHYTQGSRAQPFLKPAVADHSDTYEKIFRNNLTNA